MPQAEALLAVVEPPKPSEDDVMSAALALTRFSPIDFGVGGNPAYSLGAGAAFSLGADAAFLPGAGAEFVPGAGAAFAIKDDFGEPLSGEEDEFGDDESRVRAGKGKAVRRVERFKRGRKDFGMPNAEGIVIKDGARYTVMTADGRVRSRARRLCEWAGGRCDSMARDAKSNLCLVHGGGSARQLGREPSESSSPPPPGAMPAPAAGGLFDWDDEAVARTEARTQARAGDSGRARGAARPLPASAGLGASASLGTSAAPPTAALDEAYAAALATADATISASAAAKGSASSARAAAQLAAAALLSDDFDPGAGVPGVDYDEDGPEDAAEEEAEDADAAGLASSEEEGGKEEEEEEEQNGQEEDEQGEQEEERDSEAEEEEELDDAQLEDDDDDEWGNKRTSRKSKSKSKIKASTLRPGRERGEEGEPRAPRPGRLPGAGKGSAQSPPEAGGKRRRSSSMSEPANQQRGLGEAGEVLRAWFHAHIDDPYPTSEEKQLLLRATQMTRVQLRNWFTNMRKRHWFPARGVRARDPLIKEIKQTGSSLGPPHASVRAPGKPPLPKRRKQHFYYY